MQQMTCSRWWGFVRLTLSPCHLVTLSCLLAAGRLPADDKTTALAARIDHHIEAGWKQHGVKPAALADDAVFVRRVWLDLAGKMPPLTAARDFLDDPDPDKRRQLVRGLLRTDDYVLHTATQWGRQLFLTGNDQLLNLDQPGVIWLRQQIKDGVGSDRIVRALLAAPQGNDPAANAAQQFLAANQNRADSMAAATSRLFLGVKLECAQCHNHPFATWTREQFWGYAAFFSSLERQGPPGAVSVTGLIREFPDRREATVPGTDKVVSATFLDGSEPNWRPQVPAREILAEWMVAPDNPFFSPAAVNRLWAHFFGIGLVDPVDDMGAGNPPSHPELLDALARSFIEHGFDRKYLIRAIVLSRAYQLTSAVNAPGLPEGAEADHGPAQSEDPDSSRLFARMAVRGLSGEQFYDSLAQAVGLPVEELPAGRVVIAVNTPRARFLEMFARQDERPTEAQTSILQALALMNGRVVSGATHLEEGATLSAVAEAPFLDAAGRVETLFLATLSRRPTPEELAPLVAYLERGGPTGDARKALSDVFWALLNSLEFRVNH
jgi:Protein of unknown function (DUF1553)/Protein of unknown function (DUF1549)